MKKLDLIKVLAKKVGFSKKTAAETIDVLLETIKTTLAKGEKVVISGFGTFRVKMRASRKVVIPKTNIEKTVPARKVARFIPGKPLKKAVR
ncbi:MAG: HU family DNA-binding protein [bacterium]|nr:HU family DNA-binding protein [bacterium]